MLTKIIRYAFLAMAVLYLLIDIYIYSCYQSKFTTKAIAKTKTYISSIPSDSIPNNIVNAWEKVYPQSLTHKIYPDLLWILFSHRHNNSYPQINLAYDISFTSGLKIISLANQLDNHFSQKQIIYVVLSRTDYGNNTKGLADASEVYYHKGLKELNERECLELVIMYDNPAYFNKWRFQYRLDERVNKVLSGKN